MSEGWPNHHVAYNSSAISVTISFLLDAQLQNVSGFIIYVDGTAYTAATSDNNDGRVKGQVSVPVPDSPREFTAYATATQSGYSGQVVLEDSRNPPQGTPNWSGPYGMGHDTHFIMSNVKLKALTWMNLPCAVQDNDVNHTVYPNANAPYHAVFINGSVEETQLLAPCTKRFTSRGSRPA